MEKNITQISKGLHKDNSEGARPEGTYQYALNAVNETEEGDLLTVSNEESNEEHAELKLGYVPIGKVYIGNNKTLVFQTNADDTLSEIGVIDVNGRYTSHVNFNLGFKVTNQIDAIFRLRQGCETTIYWVDGDNNKPMYYVLEKPDRFKNEDGEWDKNKFENQRSYGSVPVFEDVTVLNSGGQQEPGSLNIGIQYLDENLNPSEWVTTSEIIRIYNSDTDDDFLDIRGSINISPGQDEEDYRTFSTTTKSTVITLGNLDQSFLFYRLAFIEATSGNGQITDIKYSDNIPIKNNVFTYTGENYVSKGTAEDIIAVTSIIGSAGSILQIDNMMVLADIKGKKIDYCKLQKYASRINADMTTHKVILNSTEDPSNPKSPTVEFEYVGYQPGEIYSFAIVYVFADGTTSPAYHIPGKSHNIIGKDGKNVAEDFIFSPAENKKVYPMSIDNESVNNRYTDRNSCGNNSFWGVDSMGIDLKSKRVRHHRFPYRSDLGLKLVNVEDTTSGENTYYQVELSISGDLKTSCTEIDIEKEECTTLFTAEPFNIVVKYKVNGVEREMFHSLYPGDYTGSHPTTNISLSTLSGFAATDDIEIISIQEFQDVETPFEVTVPTGNGTGKFGTLTYSTSVVEATFSTESKLYSTEVFGIQFSNVIMPSLEDMGGEEVVGYYIVRNNRSEEEKTILDSAVLTPMVKNSLVKEELKYISHGLLFPEFFIGKSKVSDKFYGLINPEYKFNNRKYSEFSSLKQEGQFELTERHKSKSRFLDTLAGTSFDAGVHKKGGGTDSDGWSLKAITRDNVVSYEDSTGGFDFSKDKVEDVFFLEALQSKKINSENVTIYNIAGDNKVGILELKKKNADLIQNKLPYIYMIREVADSYSTFRSLPYYKISGNIHKFKTPQGTFNPSSSVVDIYGGDSYVSPMRYVNTLWWDNKLAKRAGKTSAWNYIIGGILVVVGVVLAFFTGGSTLYVTGAGIALMGGGALFVASGVKKDMLVKAYYSEYDKGLRESSLDNWVEDEYIYYPCKKNNVRMNCHTPEDDEIEWIADCVTDMWFDSALNISLRYGTSTGLAGFLDAPGIIESGNTQLEDHYEHYKIYKQRDVTIFPATKLDIHIMDKLSTFNPDSNGGKEYLGHPLGEYYEINPDYQRINKQKVFNHLPLEYDCCSDCQEEFPHRVHYSQQAYQEELTDNFRVFLPNNYVDLEGESGKITDLFKMKNNIYIQTEESLWHQPQNYQERVTGDIVSFIGTGGYFNTPARKIIDDNKVSAGSKHKWGSLETKFGRFIISENEGKIYRFDGNSLEPVSDKGLSTWFKNNLPLQLAKDYYKKSGNPYPYDNNPSSKHGIGFVSTYDTDKERILITKQDRILNSSLTENNDFGICAKGGEMIVFENQQETISEYGNQGWEYLGLEGCRMKFQKTGYREEIIMGEVTMVSSVPPDTIVIPFYDMTSMTSSTVANISATIDTWFPGFKASVNGGINNITLINSQVTWNKWNTENWVKDVPRIVINALGEQQSVLLLVFVDEVNTGNDPNRSFHGRNFTTPMSAPTEYYISSLVDFVGGVHAKFKSFTAINYPIVRNTDECREYLQHTIAAIEGKNMTQIEVEALKLNPAFTLAGWELLKSNLRNNLYRYQTNLNRFGWLYKENRVDGVDNNGSVDCPVDGISVITPCQFTKDVQEILKAKETVTKTPTEIKTLVPYTQFTFVDGTVSKTFPAGNNSWTMSYSLKADSWTSWHSYLPNFYYYIANKFSSWRNLIGTDKNKNTFWRHGKKASYQTFYGVKKPFSIEYVAMSENIKTKIWDDITLYTETKKFDEDTQEFVDVNNITFNKAIFYNTRQCSGLLNLKVKDPNSEEEDYMSQQIANIDPGTIFIDKNERNWNINDIRDIRVDYSKPIFNSNIMARQDAYYTDKVLNESTLDINKDWSELESLRDKHLVVRLIFDTFDEVKLILNYSIESETKSDR